MPLSRHSVGTYLETNSQRISSENIQLQSSQLAEPLWTDPGLNSGISVRELISTLKKKTQEKSHHHHRHRLHRSIHVSVWSFIPAGSPSRDGDVTVCVKDINQSSLPHSFLFCSCVYFRLYGPFNCISFRKFSQQLSVF